MSFVSPSKVNLKNVGGMLKLGVGGLGCLIFSSIITSLDGMANKVFSVILLIPFSILLISGIKGRLRLKKLYRIDALISGCERDNIKLTALSEATGIKEKKLRKLLKFYLKKKLIQNCTLDVESAEPRLIFELEAQEDVEVECPSCELKFTAHTGAVIRCPECASIINYKQS